MTDNNHLQADAIACIRGADFREAWPIDVRKALVRAAQTEDEFPAYAVRLTERALRTAHAIERRMARDIEVGEASLSHAERRRLVRSN